MLSRYFVPLSLGLCLGMTIPAQGQARNPQGTNSSPSRQSSRDDDDAMRRVRRISGRVERTKQVDLRGTKDKELVVLLRTQDGSKRVVDLGATRKLGDHRVRTGDRISIEGRVMKIGKFQVLVANELNTGERWYSIERPLHPRTKPGSYSVVNQTRKIQARILDTRRVGLRDSNQQHLLARVKDSDGKLHVVDFGNANSRHAGKLDAGSRVTIHGRDMLVDDRKLVLALKVIGQDDESIRISREGTTQQQER